MKKKCNKKIRIMAMMIALAMIVQVFAPAMTVKAAKKTYFPKDFYCYYEPTSTYANEFSIQIENFPKNGKVKNVKSSKSSVVKASLNTDFPDMIKFKIKKPGKSTITFSISSKGTTKKYKCQFKVLKYKKPCQTFKLNGKNYASKFNGRSQNEITYKGSKKYKISLKAAKGWKLDTIYYYNGKTGKEKTIKNNKTFTLPKGKDTYSTVCAMFYNKKSNTFMSLYMNFRGK